MINTIRIKEYLASRFPQTYFVVVNKIKQKKRMHTFLKRVLLLEHSSFGQIPAINFVKSTELLNSTKQENKISSYSASYDSVKHQTNLSATGVRIRRQLTKLK